MTRKVVKSTERGQITLPKQWRRRFRTDSYLVHMDDEKLIVVPIHLGILADESVVFDAERDNNGKGVSPEQMIKALKKIRHGRH